MEFIRVIENGFDYWEMILTTGK